MVRAPLQLSAIASTLGLSETASVAGVSSTPSSIITENVKKRKPEYVEEGVKNHCFIAALNYDDSALPTDKNPLRQALTDQQFHDALNTSVRTHFGDIGFSRIDPENHKIRPKHIDQHRFL